jgi:hypothetical protein
VLFVIQRYESNLPILALYIDRRLCAKLNLVFVAITTLTALLLLLSSGKPGQFLKTQQQQIAAVGGFLGLSYAARNLFWRFYGDILHARLLAFGFYIGWKILGGMFLAMLICILARKNIKVLLSLSALLLLAFNLVVILGYWTGRLSAALLFPSLGIGILIGISVYCGMLLRPEGAMSLETCETNRIRT